MAKILFPFLLILFLLACGSKAKSTVTQESPTPKQKRDINYERYYKYFHLQYVEYGQIWQYYTIGKMDLKAMKELCQDVKRNSKKMTVVAVFDKKENCQDATNEISIAYYNDDEAQKHIKAYYYCFPTTNESMLQWYGEGNMRDDKGVEYPI
jgi:hypothetical protein